MLAGLAAANLAYAVSDQDVFNLEREMYSDDRVREGVVTLNGVRVPSRRVDLGGLEVISNPLGHSFFTEIKGLYGMYFDFNKDGQIDAISVSTSKAEARMNELNARGLYHGDTESLRLELELKGMLPRTGDYAEWVSVFAEDGTNYFADFRKGTLTTHTDELREGTQESYDEVFNWALEALEN